MYLARFEGEGGSLLQGLVQIAYPAVDDSDARRRWLRAFERVLRGLSAVPQCACALRVLLKEGTLDAGLLIVAAGDQEPALRRCLGAFTRLNTIVEDSIALPLSRALHDAVIESFPRYRCQLVMPAYQVDDAWLACDFRAAPVLNELIAAADTLGYCLGYQVNLQPVTVLPEWLKQTGKNALRIRGLPGVPPAVTALQERLANRMHEATALSEEYLAVETEEAAGWLSGTLRREFDLKFGRVRLDPPEFVVVDRGYETSLSAVRHRFTLGELKLDEICSDAATEAERISLLTWSPDEGVVRRFRRLPVREPQSAEAVADAAESAGLVELPEPYPGEKDYLFVSYKREDLSRIAPVLQQLEQWGYRMWYDRGIPGGAEWDALIEERIEHCSVLLLFVSEASVRSRYVRREAKYADALSKTVLGVKLDDARLSDGMDMLLRQYQTINARDEGLSTKLARAFRFLEVVPAPRC